MENKIDNAANALMGRRLKDKWEVIKKVEPKEGATGGFFSICYLVSDGEKTAFLKALNFMAFFQLFRKQKSIVEILQEQTSAFQYEKELLLRCKNNRLSKVSTILDEGEEFIEEYTIPNVPYLIFELADGDVRSRINFNNQIELAWKLKSLHNVAVGLNQLHSIEIGHQDLKPSNVLIYEKGIVSKIGDLGRSLCNDIEAPHEDEEGNFPGDFKYAPPEFLYKFNEPDFVKRVRATDLYLFGSLITFYFTGTNMTALIGKNIDPSFKWSKWGGNFDSVLDYLKDGFYKALKEFKSSIPSEEFANELTEIIRYSCFPDPRERGHFENIRLSKTNSLLNQYSFERIISKLNLLSKKAEYIFN